MLTEPLSIKRSEAIRLVKRLGGVVEKKTTENTSVVIVGEDSPYWLADQKGRKLLDVDRKREKGHRIALMKGTHFLALAGVR